MVVLALFYSSSAFYRSTTPRPLRSTLFPYTTLFRSCVLDLHLITSVDFLQLHLHTLREGGRQILPDVVRSEEHTSELQSLTNLVCRLLLEKKKKHTAKQRLNIQLVYIVVYTSCNDKL